MSELVKRIVHDKLTKVEWKETMEVTILALVFCFCLFAVSPTFSI